MAASARDDAAKDIQIAGTMLKIADGIEDGSIKKLSKITAKTHVDLLDKLAVQAQYENWKGKYSYAEQQQQL